MKEQTKKQIEKLKEDMSDLQKMALEASTLDLIILGITGWAICPLIMICGLSAKLYYYLHKKDAEKDYKSIEEMEVEQRLNKEETI